MPTITTGDPAAVCSIQNGDKRHLVVGISGDRSPAAKQKTNGMTERDTGMHNALGLALRGGVASKHQGSSRDPEGV